MDSLDSDRAYDYVEHLQEANAALEARVASLKAAMRTVGKWAVRDQTIAEVWDSLHKYEGDTWAAMLNY